MRRLPPCSAAGGANAQPLVSAIVHASSHNCDFGKLFISGFDIFMIGSYQCAGGKKLITIRFFLDLFLKKNYKAFYYP